MLSFANRHVVSKRTLPHFRAIYACQWRAFSSTNPEGQLNPNLFTEMAWESLSRLPTLADKYKMQYLEAPLLMRSVLDGGRSSLAHRILVKAGIKPQVLDDNLENYLKNQPQVSLHSNKVIGKSLSECLTTADGFRSNFEDQYISVEHLLLSLASTAGYTKQCFIDAGNTGDQLMDAVKRIRGGGKVDSRNPENTYEALAKYTIDLTAASKEGKLDPVIGRDEEIRRTIQILSRRTKNNPVLLGEPGVGKTAIAEGLAQRISNGSASYLYCALHFDNVCPCCM